ncbi:MAG: polyamine aminopropyltransferase [Alphaproteobacteria bacterium]|nr:polyamine aminopropyltransferase [Alphaproteobacteria bacterium]
MTQKLNWAWFDESLGEGYRLGLEIEKTLHESGSIGLYETARFGRVLALDGVIQTTTRDEFIYHEMLAHVPIIAHGAVARVCIVGGGDGGSLREVLKHDVAATLVEIDGSVIELCKTHLPDLSAGAFDDPRAEIVIADGAAFMGRDGPSFDIIIVDSTDPIGPGAVLFTKAFTAACRDRLAPGGILVTQNGVPFVQGAELKRSLGHFRALFADAACYLAPVPTYFGGFMAFGWATDDPATRHLGQDEIAARFERARIETRYYTPAIHKAAFALPGYVQEFVEG